nr:Chain C, MYELIN BASIC PROTEIN [Homo sapiens]
VHFFKNIVTPRTP